MTAIAAVATSLTILSPAASAQDQARPFDIPAQSLGAALLEFSRQSDVMIVVSPTLTIGKRSTRLRGTLSVSDAIDHLLRGTALHAVRNPRGGFSVERDRRGRALAVAAPPAARAVTASMPEPVPAMTDIIVTAQKRRERLQDTPVPVSVVEPPALLERNETRLQDYFVQVPGLNLAVQGNGTTVISIRGIVTGNYGNPTVAVMVDDVPFGSSTSFAGGQLVQPDLDPADLERIEVLRGPQGTLYGASSLGGLVKYVTSDPSQTGVSAGLQTDVSTARDGGMGYGLRAWMNVPLSDTVALRAGGVQRRIPGYVDNIESGKADVNAVDVASGRLAILWEPSRSISIKLGFLHQDTKGDGTSTVATDYLQRPIYGDLNQSLLAGSGAFRTRVTLATANGDLLLGKVTLKSITGYGISSYREASDLSPLFVAAPYNLPRSKLANDFSTNKFSEEVRLTSPDDEAVAWQIGAFYTYERSPSVQKVFGVDPSSGMTTSVALDAHFPSTYREIAVFGDGTYPLASRLKVQLGVRYSVNWQTYRETDTGPVGVTSSGTPFTTSARSKDQSTTFLIVPQYRFGPHAMAYARVASGYRPGGPNPTAGLFGLPPTFNADRTVNYEIGFKGEAPNRDITYDLAAYFIDWRGIQIRQTDAINQLSYFTNAGRAVSKGIEATISYRPIGGPRVVASVSYNDAKFATTPPATVYAAKGDRLPFSPRFSGSLLADQDVPLGDGWVGFVGATFSYVGERPSGIPAHSGDVRVMLPAYATIDLRVGAKTRDWSLTVFARNITDERGVLYSSSQDRRALTTSPYSTNVIVPRTVGLSISRSL